MRSLRVRNVTEALPMGLELLLSEGVAEDSRAGRVIVAPWPVTTAYTHPRERVLFSAIRDANPFFHLVEALWMIAGRSDAGLLNLFVRDFGDRYAEPGGDIHGAYGHRWRGHFWRDNHVVPPGAAPGRHIDQLDEAVRILKEDPTSRQVVIAMWDPTIDLGVPGLKDRPCNTHIYLRVRMTEAMVSGDRMTGAGPVLDLTVMCRSNDIIWGAYGANAVHFSVLQEYLAARIGVDVGTFYQVSNNFHAYEKELHRLAARAGLTVDQPDLLRLSRLSARLEDQRYGRTVVFPDRLVDAPETFALETQQMLATFEARTDDTGYWEPENTLNKFLSQVAWPMLCAHKAYRRKAWSLAFSLMESVQAQDWRVAAIEWMERRRDLAS